MDIKLMCVLLGAATLTVLGQNESSRWSRQSLPTLLDDRTELLNKPLYGGERDKKRGGDEEKGDTKTLCGIECQQKLPQVDEREQERVLGYETMYENGTLTHTDVTLQGFNITHLPSSSSSRTRNKRQVYGTDGRFVISDSHFITRYPFSTAVRLSTGCSGVLVSSKHVLTAAHCIHDGKKYLEQARKLRVGVLQLKTRRNREGKRGRRKQRGGRKRKEDATEERIQAGEGEELNSIDEGQVRGRQGGLRRRVRTGSGNTVESKRRGKPRRGGLRRIRRSDEPRKKPAFRWTRVKLTQIPQGWIQSESASDSVASDYDYALLELKRPLKQKFMELGVVPSSVPLSRIHFSGYDADKSQLAGRTDEKVVYRFCSVAKESEDLMYQHCDAQPGATGAGVYIRLRRDVQGGGKGKWQRRVIGVFSGHQLVELEKGEQRDFNIAVRITPPKYAQICHWIHRDPSLCKEV